VKVSRPVDEAIGIRSTLQEDLEYGEQVGDNLNHQADNDDYPQALSVLCETHVQEEDDTGSRHHCGGNSKRLGDEIPFHGTIPLDWRQVEKVPPQPPFVAEKMSQLMAYPVGELERSPSPDQHHMCNIKTVSECEERIFYSPDSLWF
jgi:hypothetical protein